MLKNFQTQKTKSIINYYKVTLFSYLTDVVKFGVMIYS